MMKRLIAAIDTAKRAEAEAIARAVAPHCGLVKLGLEYFLANGPAGLISQSGVLCHLPKAAVA